MNEFAQYVIAGRVPAIHLQRSRAVPMQMMDYKNKSCNDEYALKKHVDLPL